MDFHQLTPRQQAVAIARQRLAQQPVYIDTETTGLDKTAEIVEIAIIDHDGSILFDELVKPARPIPADAAAVHHITNDMVASAKTWAVHWPIIRSILFGRVIGFYNEEFDMRMIRQTHQNVGLPWKENFQTFCVMKMYAQFAGQIDPRRRTYKYHKLENAGRDCGIPLPNSHRAADDTLLTRALLEFMASYTGK
ncbi:MAG: 3'-5' exonuclease [Anaerolineaceae bacterium]|jgi:DNA polymerase-3 subunit epsilon|nr:3'-5' exonuclease [Anaerolineaceae bacterium]